MTSDRFPSKIQSQPALSHGGSVTDSSGAVIPNATVTATSTTQGTKLSRITSSSGDFDLTPLNPDVYRITVTANGFQTLNQENVHVNALEVTSNLPSP
jgi:hypothetical protein